MAELLPPVRRRVSKTVMGDDGTYRTETRYVAFVDAAPLVSAIGWAVAHGHGIPEIARESGIPYPLVYNISQRNYRRRVSAETMEKIGRLILSWRLGEGGMPGEARPHERAV